jgi:hypothetical protein
LIIVTCGFFLTVAAFNNRVITTGMKRMAFYKPNQCEVTTFKKSIMAIGLFGVGRTAGIKPAISTG